MHFLQHQLRRITIILNVLQQEYRVRSVHELPPNCNIQHSIRDSSRVEHVGRIQRQLPASTQHLPHHHYLDNHYPDHQLPICNLVETVNRVVTG